MQTANGCHSSCGCLERTRKFCSMLFPMLYSAIYVNAKTVCTRSTEPTSNKRTVGTQCPTEGGDLWKKIRKFDDIAETLTYHEKEKLRRQRRSLKDRETGKRREDYRRKKAGENRCLLQRMRILVFFRKVFLSANVIHRKFLFVAVSMESIST